MKPTTVIVIILYLALFGFGSWWLYNRYFSNTVTSPDNSQTAITPDKTIFYTKGNNLYQLNADVLNASSKDIANLRLQSTGQVSAIVIAKEPQLLFYEVATPLKINEIWQVNLNDNQSEKLLSEQTPGFEKYTNFRNPKLSFNQEYLAFIASIDGQDQIFSYKISDKSITNLIYPIYAGQISDFDWSTKNLDIYFVAKGGGKSIIKTVDLNKKITNLWENSASITKISITVDKIILLYQLTDVSNLGYLTLTDPTTINPITDLTAPKTVLRYNVANITNSIVYQVNDTVAKTNDIYIVKTDSTNLLQLTNNGKSYYPIFSPLGDKIAFWADGEGIYTIMPDKQTKQKILNDPNTINNIIKWS